MKNNLFYKAYKAALPKYLENKIPKNKDILHREITYLNCSRLTEYIPGDSITIGEFKIEIVEKVFKQVFFWKIFKGFKLKITQLKPQANERKIHKTRR